MNAEVIKLLFTGDFSPIGAAQSENGKPYQLAINQKITDLFKDHDLSVVNLESPLTNSIKKIKKSGPHLKGNPESIAILRDLGIHVACLSNNHIRDYDDQGVIDTLKTCHANGIKTVGAGANLHEASEILYLNVKGFKIALLNFSETEFNTATDHQAGSNPDDVIHIWYSVNEAKKKSDYQIVVMHGGKEMYSFPTPQQIKLYRFVADLGVSAIIGHHSHVFGGYEYYKGIPIVYSLGNFIFDEEGNEDEWYKGVIASLTLKSSHENQLTFFPIVLKEKEVQFQLNKPLNGSYSIDIPPIESVETILQEWEKLIASQSLKIIKGLLGTNIITLGLLKFNLISKATQSNILLKFLHRFRCKTHEIITIDAIKHFTKLN